MSETFSVVGTEDSTYDLFCRSDRCPLLEIHHQHDVNRTIDKLILDCIPSARVVQLGDINADSISLLETVKALRRLISHSKLKAVYPDNNPDRSPVAYYRNDNCLSDIAWSSTALVCVPRLPKASAVKLNALDETILGKIGRYVLKVFWQIYQDVKHDYGSVADRTVYRRLRHLVDAQVISRISLPMINDGGYVLPGSPLLNDMSSAYEQIRVAHLERRSI